MTMSDMLRPLRRAVAPSARLMRPGTAWMRRQPLHWKLGALALAMSLPLLLLLGVVLLQFRAELVRDGHERDGTQAVQQLTRLVADVQQLRLLHAGAAAPGDAQRAAALQAGLRQTLDRLDPALGTAASFAAPASWPRARDAVLAWTAAAAADADDGRGRVAADALLQTIAETADSAGLLSDPERSTRWLAELGSLRLPRLAEAATRAAIDGASRTAAGGAPIADLRWTMATRVEDVERTLAGSVQVLDALKRLDVHAPGDRLRLLESARNLSGAVRAAFDGQAQLADARGLLAAGALALAPVHRMTDNMLGELDARLQLRAAAELRLLLLMLAACVASTLLALYLAATFVRSFSGSVKAMQTSLKLLADGDLSVRVEVSGNDELAQMGHELERTAHMLSGLVAEIRTSAVRVDQAGSDLARDGAMIAQATEGQGSNVRDASLALRRLGAAATESEALVTQLALRSSELGAQGAGCREMVGRSVQAMNELDDSVRRVAEVNAMIDDITFQTNLLSINASVEAARAGESGKGFGVVAASVRALSQRCSDAAAEVRELIDRTAGQSALSRDSVAEAERMIGVVADGVSWMHTELQRVALADHQQHQGLDDIARAVGELEALDASRVRALTAAQQASRVLAGQADALRSSVGTIRLRQGSADEAQALVERALLRIAEVGWERAVREFHQPGTGFVDRDLYLFAVDRDDRYVVAGFNPGALGRALHELPHMTTTMAGAYLASARAAAAAGSGWIDYQLLNPATGQPLEKTAYIADLGDGAFIGCGVVRQLRNQPTVEPPVHDRLALAATPPLADAAVDAPLPVVAEMPAEEDAVTA